MGKVNLSKFAAYELLMLFVNDHKNHIESKTTPVLSFALYH
jgi:hypothetical protein